MPDLYFCRKLDGTKRETNILSASSTLRCDCQPVIVVWKSLDFEVVLDMLQTQIPLTQTDLVRQASLTTFQVQL